MLNNLFSGTENATGSRCAPGSGTSQRLWTGPALCFHSGQDKYGGTALALVDACARMRPPLPPPISPSAPSMFDTEHRPCGNAPSHVSAPIRRAVRASPARRRCNAEAARAPSRNRGHAAQRPMHRHQRSARRCATHAAPASRPQANLNAGRASGRRHIDQPRGLYS